jgi:hypothetical protein
MPLNSLFKNPDGLLGGTGVIGGTVGHRTARASTTSGTSDARDNGSCPDADRS